MKHPVPRSRTGRGPGAVLAMGLLGTGLSSAAPWSVEPTVTVMTTYQSNPQFYTQTSRSGSGELVTVAAPIDWNDEKSIFRITPSANAGHTTGAAGLGKDNRSLGAVWNSNYARGSWRASGQYDQFDFFGAPNADLGVVRPVGYSDNAAYAVGATWLADERSSLGLDGSRRSVVYHISTGQPYTNYVYEAFAAQYSHTLSERVQLLASGSTGEFKSANNQTTRDRSIQFGASGQLWQTVSGSATFGKSEAVSSAGNATSVGVVYSASLTWTRPTTNVGLSAKKSQQPGALGDLVLETDFNLGASWNVSERLSLALSLTVTKLQDTLFRYDLTQRNYNSREFSVSYLLTPQWRVELHLNNANVAYPASFTNGVATAASSSGGNVSLVRVFGRTRLT